MSSNCTSRRRPPVVDYHVHPDFSIDAQGSVDEFCQVALSRGLDEICFTTHYDADPRYLEEDGWVVVGGKRRRLTQPWLDVYQAQIEAARRVYGPQGLAVKMGLEISHFPGADAPIAELLQTWPLDYVLGALHWVDGYPISFRPLVAEWLSRLGPEAALAGYYRALARAAASGLFDCLAHIDLYRRTTGDLAEDVLDLPDVAAAVTDLMQACAGSRVGLEINTRDAQDQPAGTSPGPKLLRLAAEAGVDVVVTGSDSHAPDRLGRGVARGITAAREAGFAQITTFDRRRQTRHRLDI